MNVMIKKHINLPVGLDALLKQSVKSGCFASESEAFRTAITLLLFEQQKLSPIADYRLLKEVSENIAIANQRAQKYQLIPAIEQMTIACDILKTRMTISLSNDENEDFEKPSWIGGEVTNDHRYLNSNLIKHPYKYWQAS